MARRLDLPLSPGLLALGELDDSGRVHGSPEVSRLLELLRARGTAHPTTLLVEPGCAVQLRRLPGLRDRSVRVLGVSSFAEALSSGLQLVPLAYEGQLWSADQDVGWLVERLFTLALESQPVPCGWRLLSALAVGLTRRLPLDGGSLVGLQSSLRWKLAFVRDVARRHAGESARMDWPEPEILEAFPAEVRWQILAHVLQSASDSDLPSTLAYTEKITSLLATEASTLSPSKTRLRGALGRALAAVGRHTDAEIHLRQAIEDWQRLAPVEASYPLCELLRILGIRGQREAIHALHARVRPFLESPSVTSAFVGLAWGRALIQCAEDGEGLAALASPPHFALAPDHVSASRYRWLSVAQRRLGHQEAAAATMDLLEAMGDRDQLHLARLDARFEQGELEALDPHAQALLEATEGGNEALLALSRLAPEQEPRWAVRDIGVLDRLRCEYRY